MREEHESDLTSSKSPSVFRLEWCTERCRGAVNWGTEQAGPPGAGRCREDDSASPEGTLGRGRAGGCSGVKFNLEATHTQPTENYS